MYHIPEFNIVVYLFYIPPILTSDIKARFSNVEV